MSVAIDLKSIDGFDDKNLSEKLKQDITKSIKIVLQHRTVLVFVDDIFSYKGKFADFCLKVIKNKPNISFFKIKYPTNTIFKSISNVTDITPFNINDISEWTKKTTKRLNPNTETEKTLWSNAKEHCQMCGRDLSMHYATKQRGNLAQIAHIEASGVDGPRNNSELENTNELDNLMLLCYDCHRIIDFINPEKYTIDLLKKIKNEQEKRVKSLLNTLSNPQVYPIRISTRLYGNDCVSPTDREIIEALNGKNLSIAANFLQKNLLDTAWEKREAHNGKYWENFFQTYNKQIIFIKDQLEQSKTQHNSSGIALFLYHGISEMILLGNQFGDTVNIHLFQKHRDNNKDFNWEWPNEKDKSGQTDLEFYNKIEKNCNGESEGLLIVELSGELKISNLPKKLYDKGYCIPTMKVTTDLSNQRPTVISKEKDLNEAKTLINKTLKKMRDEWKLNKIHIIVIAPQVINFHIGCAIQSKYQAEIICYERNSNTSIQEPTICIKENIAYFYSKPSVSLDLIP